MSLSIGIVGLPNVGKSTLFRALTRQRVLIANYPFATIEPNSGIVAVPDARLTALAEVFKPVKVTPASVKFIDIAGLVAGAHKGEGLGNKFLAHIRETDAICMVVRAFTDANVIRHIPDVRDSGVGAPTEASEVDATTDPKRDIETIKTELILADLETITASLGRFEKQAKADPKLLPSVQGLAKVKDSLNSGQTVNDVILSKAEGSTDRFLDKLGMTDDISRLVKNLITAKPFIYVFNIDEDKVGDDTYQKQLADLVTGQPVAFISAKLEAELADLEPKEAADLLKSVGLAHSGLEELVRMSYQTLGLITYFTAGEPEVRAWTIHKGDKAPDAAGVIHGDFKRGFIAAETIDSKTLLASGSWQTAKTKGLVRTEGKDYSVADGDVMLFRFNV